MYGKELLDDQHSCAGGAGSQPVSLGGWVAQILKDLGVPEKVCTKLTWNSARVVITLSHLANSTNCLRCFFAFGWWLVWYSWNPICRYVAFEFLCSPEVICGNTGKWRAVPAKQKTPAATRIPNHKNNKQTSKLNHKYTNKKQNNQNLSNQTQPSCVNNGSMYNRVKKSMEYR